MTQEESLTQAVSDVEAALDAASKVASSRFGSSFKNDQFADIELKIAHMICLRMKDRSE